MSCIYSNIVRLAKEKELSISKLEREANLASGTISKWKTASPTIDNLQAVAKVLNVTVNELLETKSEDEKAAV